MSDNVEKVIFIVFGATTGTAVASTLLSFPLVHSFLKNDFSIIGLMSLIGIFVSISIYLWNINRLSKESDKLRSETVAIMTHEMRTALTSTSWSIGFILKTYDQKISEVDKKMLEDIVKSIHATVMHTVNLLDVSLLDIGKLSISLEWITLEKVEEMFKEIMDKYKLGVEKEGIVLLSKIKLDPKKEVEVDTLRLRIIIENLLENAIQYTKHENKKIEVDVTNTATTLEIIVRDTGIGIPEKEQGKIFAEFFRASNARRKLSSGSGIGLHMCAQYVKAHHGTIRFESKENEGTTFFISIPLKTVADVNEFLAKV